jgi:hypothetical protein
MSNHAAWSTPFYGASPVLRESYRYRPSCSVVIPRQKKSGMQKYDGTSVNLEARVGRYHELGTRGICHPSIRRTGPARPPSSGV